MQGLLKILGTLVALALFVPMDFSPSGDPEAEADGRAPTQEEEVQPPEEKTEVPPQEEEVPPPEEKTEVPPQEEPPPTPPPSQEGEPPQEPPVEGPKPPDPEPPAPEQAPPEQAPPAEEIPETGIEDQFDFDVDAILFEIKKDETPTVMDLLQAIDRHTKGVVVAAEKLDVKKEIKFVGRPVELTYPLIRIVLDLNDVKLIHKKTEDGRLVIEAIGAGRGGDYAGKLIGQPTPVEERSRTGPEVPEMVTRIYRLKHADGVSLNQTLRQIKRPDPREPGTFQHDGGTNTFIIRDIAPNVEYLVRILEALDIPGPDMTFRVITLQKASADAVAQIIESFLRGGGRGAAARQVRRAPRQPAAAGRGQFQEPQVLADPRTNKIIIYAFPKDMESIEDLIAELDVDVPFSQGKLHHYVLKDTQADEIAAVLNAVIQGTSLETPGAPATPGGVRRPQVGRTARTPGQLQGQGAVGEVTTRIVPDPQTNSLIIQAEPDVYSDLELLIAKLDQKKNQIFIEAQIWEVGIDDTLDLGVELVTLDRPTPGTTRGGALTNFGLTTIEVDDPTNPTTFVRTPTITTGLTTFIMEGAFDRVPFVLNALARDSEARILSTPFAITNDNSIARFTISDRVPFQTSTVAGSGLAQGGFQFADATTLLEIEPTISSGDRLQLRIIVDIQTFTGTALGGAPPPSNSRRYEGTVTVPDRKYVVVGGLEQEQILEDISKVPILGDIPLIGLLFRSSQKIKRRSRIFFFIKPTIFADESFTGLKEASRGLQAGLKDFSTFDYDGTVLDNETRSTPQELNRLIQNGRLYHLDE